MAIEERPAAGENPTDEDLDVEGPNESAQPSGAPGLEGGEDEQAEDQA